MITLVNIILAIAPMLIVWIILQAQISHMEMVLRKLGVDVDEDEDED